jgi:hypothetical protein
MLTRGRLGQHWGNTRSVCDHLQPSIANHRSARWPAQMHLDRHQPTTVIRRLPALRRRVRRFESCRGHPTKGPVNRAFRFRRSCRHPRHGPGYTTGEAKPVVAAACNVLGQLLGLPPFGHVLPRLRDDLVRAALAARLRAPAGSRGVVVQPKERTQTGREDFAVCRFRLRWSCSLWWRGRRC